ncbi:MAG: hypothetical protein AWU57_458 [Marinobacter sp. T13-3]|nr:MAG: hypothetical protein AWU57_458 [Marinobacter sp. T13-3]
MVNSFRQLSRDIETMIRTTHGHLIVKRHPILRLVPERHRLWHQSAIVRASDAVFAGAMFATLLQILEAYESVFLPVQFMVVFVGVILLALLTIAMMEYAGWQRWKAKLSDINTVDREAMAHNLVQISNECQKAALLPEAFVEVPEDKPGTPELVRVVQRQIKDLGGEARSHAIGILADDETANLRALEFVLTGGPGDTLMGRLHAIEPSADSFRELSRGF